MSLVLTFIAASGLVRAMPAGSPYWMSDMDYPAGAVRRKEEGTVGFSMLIAPDGKVARCFITKSSSFPELDQKTCAVMLPRMKFKPARDENGAPVYDHYKAFVTWRLPGKSGGGRSVTRPIFAPDMVLEVQRLPQGETEKIVSIVVRTDDQGRVAYCEASQHEPPPPQLAAVACAQMRSFYISDLKDDAGKALPAIESIKVAFRAPAK